MKKADLQSSPGPDGVSYAGLRELDPDRVATLFNLVLFELDLPSPWLLSVIVALPKGGRTIVSPDKSRGVALESCFLKLFTSCLAQRLLEWANANALLPASQNGFRPQLRTTTKSKFLRYSIEQALADHADPVALHSDSAKAFDSVDRPLLWA